MLNFPLYRNVLFLSLFCFPFFLLGQEENNTAEILRGTLGPHRSCYDVSHYDLSFSLNYEDKSIEGSNIFLFSMVDNSNFIRFDLFENLEIQEILLNGKAVTFEREFNSVLVNAGKELLKGERFKMRVKYSGIPIVAKKAPWDGGFVWSKDKNDKPWIGVACEGIGASTWWPVKDHLSDEPDSMTIRINLPPGPLNKLIGVSNGNLFRETQEEDGTYSYIWKTHHPINTYNVTFYIGDFALIEDSYQGVTEKIQIDYYVLIGNMDVAEKHFEQVKPMLQIFEKRFGPYPFPKDGFALVDAPYWGMEHQGAIAYGNEYKNNDFGFDFIIVHESGHEWWGNNVSATDHGELWIHEAFCTYSEAVYLEELHGKEKSIEYLMTQKELIQNVHPIQGPLDVNYSEFPDADMYYKGSWMLHSLRNWVNDDPLWEKILLDLNIEFRHSCIDGDQLIHWLSEKTKKNLNPFFHQFLTTTAPPKFQYKIFSKKGGFYVKYRWNGVSKGFDMPLDLENDRGRILPCTKWKTEILDFPPADFVPDEKLFYFESEKL